MASRIRGAAVPVVDLAALLGGGTRATLARLVVLGVGDRHVALATEDVLGIRALDGTRLEASPPLLGGRHADVVEAVGALDATLLVVLRATRVLTEDVWKALKSETSSS